jgi:hypothetical protein
MVWGHMQKTYLPRNYSVSQEQNYLYAEEYTLVAYLLEILSLIVGLLITVSATHCCENTRRMLRSTSKMFY